jgi:hypothetical protein
VTSVRPDLADREAVDDRLVVGPYGCGVVQNQHLRHVLQARLGLRPNPDPRQHQDTQANPPHPTHGSSMKHSVVGLDKVWALLTMLPPSFRR